MVSSPFFPFSVFYNNKTEQAAAGFSDIEIGMLLIMNESCKMKKTCVKNFQWCLLQFWKPNAFPFPLLFESILEVTGNYQITLFYFLLTLHVFLSVLEFNTTTAVQALLRVSEYFLRRC